MQSLGNLMVVIHRRAEQHSGQDIIGLPCSKCLSQPLILKLELCWSLLQWPVDYLVNEKSKSLRKIDSRIITLDTVELGRNRGKSRATRLDT